MHFERESKNFRKHCIQSKRKRVRVKKSDRESKREREKAN